MAPPTMAPLLGKQQGGKQQASLLGTLEALALILAEVLLFWFGVHELQPVLRVHPVLMALFPLFAATCLALLLPPLVYLSFRSEFVGLHPAWPPHFAFLARRLLRALGSGGQLKVSAKEL